MKVNKYVIYIIGLIIIISAVVTCSSYKKSLNNLKEANDSIYVEMKRYKTLDSSNHVVIKTMVLDKNVMEIKFKELAKKLNVKPKDIINVINGTSVITIRDTFKTFDTLHIVDSTKVPIKYINNKWVFAKLEGDLLDMTIYDKWVITKFYSRDKWYSFKKTEHLDIETSNPYIKVTSVSDYSKKEGKPKILISPYIGVGYNPFKNSVYPSIGIGMSFDFLTYKIY